MKTRELKAHELMDGYLYLVGKQVARYRILNSGFETLDGKRLGYLTRTQRARALCCHVTTPKKPFGFEEHNEYVRAILITPEIMEKNGFRYEHDYGQYYRSILGDYAKDKEPVVCMGWNSKGEMYSWDIADGKRGASYGKRWLGVHELQNLMKICELDELADNFVV